MNSNIFQPSLFFQYSEEGWDAVGGMYERLEVGAKLQCLAAISDKLRVGFPEESWCDTNILREASVCCDGHF